jgi:hypothetical protein
VSETQQKKTLGMNVCLFFWGGKISHPGDQEKKNSFITKLLPQKKGSGEKKIIIYPEARLLPPRQGWTKLTDL